MVNIPGHYGRSAGVRMLLKRFILSLTMVALAILVACNEAPSPSLETLPAGLATSTPEKATDTPVQPSPTTELPAAMVNGEAITLAAFQAELERYASATGQEPGEEQAQQVMDSLVNQLLLAQSAAMMGFQADDQLVQERIDRLVETLGSEQLLEDWMTTHGYTDEQLRDDLKRAIEAAWMRDQIIAGVTTTAEQIHARQILAITAEEADAYYSRLQAGANFATLASEADPVAGGELGWFPRGTLYYPELEDAAFLLEPGAYTTVLQTPAGYHILQVIERDPARALSPDALLQAQHRALEEWLETKRQESEIEIY